MFNLWAIEVEIVVCAKSSSVGQANTVRFAKYLASHELECCSVKSTLRNPDGVDVANGRQFAGVYASENDIQIARALRPLFTNLGMPHMQT